ncbi:MAG TPA: tetratricopeptide repeat protein [Chitinophagaceae bacterium]|nr:tetratricopeptide repeat protein [Chitinophagaceae bacterium]
MKKFFPFLVCLFLFSVARSQDSAGMKNHYLKVYNQALAYNDANAAVNALHGYIAMDNNMLYKDTLSMLYFNIKSFYSALMLAEEVYKAVPANVEAMARAAECYDELGDPKTAVGLYEQVVPKTKNPYHIYKLAVGQYQLKRTLECEASAKAAMADTTSKKIGVAFTSVDGSQQLVPINAAAANLLGVLKMDAKNFAAAKADFQKALTLFPDFLGAKGNLDVCDKKLKGGVKTPSKPSTKPKGQ